MVLQSLHLFQFRNHAELNFRFQDGVNVITGPNGAGKTNVLDAVYYLGFTKSFLNFPDGSSVRWFENEEESKVAAFLIEGRFLVQGQESLVQISAGRGQKKIIRHNKKPYERLSDHIGRFPMVVIAPQDATLVLGGSEERRKFLDALIGQYDARYLQSLMQWNRLISQRNALLKQLADRQGSLETLDVLDDQLMLLLPGLLQTRLEFIAQFLPVFEDFYARLSGEAERPGLEYKAGLDIEQASMQFREARQKDLLLQYTSLGPHRDDLLFLLDEHPLKRFASQGQQKSYLAALKLAEHQFLKEKNGRTPLLLLDDVFDKLDPFRVQRLLELATGPGFGQTIVTDTGEQKLQEVLQKIAIEARFFEL